MAIPAEFYFSDSLAIGDWMYSVAAGIRDDESNPGYKHVILMPHPSDDIDYMTAEHHSLYGKIKSGWKHESGKVIFDFQVPANTTATLFLPGKGGDLENRESHQLGSGKQQFTVSCQESSSSGYYSLDSNFGALWKNEKTKAILIKHIPVLAQAPEDQLQPGFDFSLSQVAKYVPDIFTQEALKKIKADLAKL